MNYYNENDPKAAAWLRQLIVDGHLPKGDVDERSIAGVQPHEIRGYTQHHFFAGIGGWSLALRLAGWPEDRPVRTGSCPCQPFSVAGKGKGEADERHLWPEMRRLIEGGEHAITFGEQVASKDARDWLSGVRADLEALGYEVGAADLCAAGVGAPQIRQRIYWVANPRCPTIRSEELDPLGGTPSGMQGANWKREWIWPDLGASRPVVVQRMEHTNGRAGKQGNQREQECLYSSSTAWSNYGVLACGDGRNRRAEPGVAPMVARFPSRVGLLRGYGNAIVPQLAAEFIQASLEAIG